MLYSEFKSQFRENESEYNGEYKVEDTRNFPKQNQRVEKATTKAKPKKHKILKGIFVTLLIIILLASATLLYFELFTDNGVYTVFSTFAEKADYYYCISIGSFATLDEAKASSDNVKSKGAAGYIHYTGEYNVLLSLYLDEKTANDVAEKNGYSVLKIYKSNALKNIPPNLIGEYDKCKNFEKTLLEELYQASAILENNLDKDNAKGSISKALTKAKNSTSDFLAESSKSKLLNVQKYATKVNQAIAETEKLETNLTLSTLRQTMIFIAIIMS